MHTYWNPWSCGSVILWNIMGRHCILFSWGSWLGWLFRLCFLLLIVYPFMVLRKTGSQAHSEQIVPALCSIDMRIFMGFVSHRKKLHVSAFRLSLVRFPRPCLETVSHSAWPIVDEWPTAGHHLTMADIEDLKLPGASGPGRGAQIGVEIEIHKETPGESKVAGDSLKKEISPNLDFQLTSSSIGSFLNCGIFNFKTMNFNANICWNDLTTQFIKQQHISGHLQSDIVVFVHHPMLTPKTWHVTTVTTRWGWNVVISPQPLGETWATGGHRLHLFHGKIQGKPWENPP